MPDLTNKIPSPLENVSTLNSSGNKIETPFFQELIPTLQPDPSAQTGSTDDQATAVSQTDQATTQTVDKTQEITSLHDISSPANKLMEEADKDEAEFITGVITAHGHQ